MRRQDQGQIDKIWKLLRRGFNLRAVLALREDARKRRQADRSSI